jgi:hypothetical protein
MNMKKIFSIAMMVAISPLPILAQKVSGKLVFQQGQTFNIALDVKTKVSQEAGGNAIDFDLTGTAAHAYKVTNTTSDNSTLHHDVKRVSFKFDGMGKYSFDSDNKKDMDGLFGASAKDILSKSFDIIIDPAGKTLLVKPEKIELAKADDRLAIVFTMLKDVTNVVYPPKKNESSFFKILPDTAVGINDSWNDAGEDANGSFKTVYTLSSITDSTIIVSLKGSSASVTKAEMMGMQTTTSLKSSYTGTITLDKLSGIIKEKTITTESTGSTEAMGGNLPVTSKTTITIYVKPSL